MRNEIGSNDNNNTIKKNTFYNLIKTISTVLFPLIIFPYTSRVLGPENLGKVNFANSIVSYISLLASFGISTYAVRECAKVKSDKRELSRVGSQLFTINIVSTVIAYIVLLICFMISSKLKEEYFLILLLSFPVFFQTLGADWINTAMEDLKFVSLRTMLFQLISIIAVFLFVRDAKDYFLFAVISAGASIGANCLNIYHRKKYCCLKIVKECNVKQHIKPIIFLFALTLSQTIFLNVDTTMIGFFHGDIEVGFYSVAVKIYNLASTLISAITIVVIPQLSLLSSSVNQNESIEKVQRYALNYILTLGIPIVVGINILTPGIIHIIAGPEYYQAVSPLRILSIALLLVMLGGAFIGNVVLIPNGNEKTFMFATVIATILNCILNYCLIPKYGIIAAAYTTVISEAIILLITFFKGREYIKIKSIYKCFALPIVGAVPFALISWILSRYVQNIFIHTVATIVVCCIEYIIVELLVKNEFISEYIISVSKERRNR